MAGGEDCAFKHVFTKENPGRIDDYYKVDRKKMLGEGSYGQVVRGEDKNTKAVRAIKAIDIKKISDPKRFEDEIKIQQALDHPNIVKLFEVFKDAKRIYLVMEICSGGELFDRIVEEAEKHDGRAFTEPQVAEYMQQILGAMQYLHSHSFVHRDIKPENFLMQNKEETAAIKVIDFGLAKSWAPGSPPMTTKAGTPYYVAPQVLLSGGYDNKCDIWSCGVIAYILLCGYPPFYGDRDEDILKAVKSGKFDFPSPDWDDVSKVGKDLITNMLTMDPVRRPTAEALLAHDWLRTKPGAGDTIDAKLNLGARLRRFHGVAKLKKVALTLIAQQLKDEDIEELSKTFKTLDMNNDGTLTPQEVRDGMARHNIEVPADLEAVMRAVDSDGSGVIDYSEFIAATLTSKQYARTEVMWSAFRTFDLDGDGKITKEELAKVLQENSDSQLIGQMISEVDGDHDGEIDFDEFCEMMKKR